MSIYKYGFNTLLLHFIGRAYQGQDIVLKTIIEYTCFKVLWPLHNRLSFLQSRQSNFDKCKVRFCSHHSKNQSFTHWKLKNLMVQNDVDVRRIIFKCLRLRQFRVMQCRPITQGLSFVSKWKFHHCKKLFHHDDCLSCKLFLLLSTLG